MSSKTKKEMKGRMLNMPMVICPNCERANCEGACFLEDYNKTVKINSLKHQSDRLKKKVEFINFIQAEEEFDGAIPEKMKKKTMERINNGELEEVLRDVVRTTKNSIIDRIIKTM